MSDVIPVNEPLFDGNEKKYLIECIDTGWVSSEGPFVKRFEKDFAKQVNRKHGIAVTNGTSAIDAAIKVLGICKEDEIILPTFTIISCILQIVRSGATPVLVDADPKTWNMDISQIESKITPRTKAIMVVHIYGLPVDMDPILDICKRYGLKLIEDAAEMIGQKYKGRPCGSFGDISTVSFYTNKHITTGEGGMILTDNDQFAKKCRELRNLCFKPERRFFHEELGWNLRMTNLQAALGVAQLERLDKFLEKKRWIGHLYNKLLSDLQGVLLPLPSTDYAENIYWIYGLVLKDSINFDGQEAMKRMAEQGVECRQFFYPLHQQPALKELGLFKQQYYPVAEKISQRGFYIPSGLALTEKQITQVANSLIKIIK
jgi:perosamine synthetase